ncbi:MAG: hypothetical protein WB555_12275, partial [Candidatus Korobacteraceae bacterium]
LHVASPRKLLKLAARGNQLDHFLSASFAFQSSIETMEENSKQVGIQIYNPRADARRLLAAYSPFTKTPRARRL